jgi:uncharacterized membrane protein YhhN
MSFLLIFAVLSALLTVASDWHTRYPSFYLFKPLTTALIAAWAWPTASLPILLALLLCGLGDVALMFKGTLAFVLGLSAFLLGHGAFLLHFLPKMPALPVVGWLWAVALAAGAAGYLFYLWNSLGRLWPAVLLYVAVLWAMTVAAVASQQPAYIAGGLLFMASDGVLAWRKFKQPFVGAQALTLSTYYTAITLLSS